MAKKLNDVYRDIQRAVEQDDLANLEELQKSFSIKKGYGETPKRNDRLGKS